MKYKVLQFRVFHRIHSLLKDRILFNNLIFHDFLINWVQVIHNTTELFYFNFFFSLFLSFILYFHKDKFQFLYFLKRFRKVQKGLERFRKVQKDSESFRKVQKGSERLRKVQKGSESFRKVQKSSERGHSTYFLFTFSFNFHNRLHCFQARSI